MTDYYLQLDLKHFFHIISNSLLKLSLDTLQYGLRNGTVTGQGNT
jgi:hypothetical protein